MVYVMQIITCGLQPSREDVLHEAFACAQTNGLDFRKFHVIDIDVPTVDEHIRLQAAVRHSMSVVETKNTHILTICSPEAGIKRKRGVQLVYVILAP